MRPGCSNCYESEYRSPTAATGINGYTKIHILNFYYCIRFNVFQNTKERPRSEKCDVVNNLKHTYVEQNILQRSFLKEQIMGPAIATESMHVALAALQSRLATALACAGISIGLALTSCPARHRLDEDGGLSTTDAAGSSSEHLCRPPRPAVRTYVLKCGALEQREHLLNSWR